MLDRKHMMGILHNFKQKVREWNASHANIAASVVTVGIIVIGLILLKDYLFPGGFGLSELQTLAQEPAKASVVLSLLVAALMGGHVPLQVAQNTQIESIQQQQQVFEKKLGKDYVQVIVSAVNYSENSEKKITDLDGYYNDHKTEIEELKKSNDFLKNSNDVLKKSNDVLFDKLKYLEKKLPK